MTTLYRYEMHYGVEWKQPCTRLVEDVSRGFVVCLLDFAQSKNNASVGPRVSSIDGPIERLNCQYGDVTSPLS